MGNQVLQFTLDGKYMKKIGTMGQGPGEYNFPCWIFVQNDRLYISDNGNISSSLGVSMVSVTSISLWEGRGVAHSLQNLESEGFPV
jgi:hypothetical protein